MPYSSASNCVVLRLPKGLKAQLDAMALARSTSTHDLIASELSKAVIAYEASLPSANDRANRMTTLQREIKALSVEISARAKSSRHVFKMSGRTRALNEYEAQTIGLMRQRAELEAEFMHLSIACA